MLLGYYSREGRPLLEASVDFPDLSVTDRVAFLIDTGADISLLSPAGCERLGIDQRLRDGTSQAIPSPHRLAGIGGPIHPFLVRAHLYMSTASGTFHHDFGGLNVLTPAMVGSYAGFDHSRLGWDFLRGFRVILDRRLDFAGLLLPDEPWPRL